MPPWLEFVERFFVLLTASVVAFGILLVEMDFLHWAWGKIRGKAVYSSGLGTPSPGPDRLPQTHVPRFDLQQRIQHVLLMSSFIILAVTGISQKYYRMEPFDSFIVLMGGMETLRLIHRVAGGILILDGLYHLLYLAPSVLGFRRGVPRINAGHWVEMIPNLKDAQDFFQGMGYFLGRTQQPPQFGRFSYLQKFDYWSVFWGLTIMAGSGVIMLAPVLGVQLTGTAMIAAALAAHSDEAILAVAWILIVHMYHAHLAPRVFPFNSTIFTGNIPTKLLQEEHSLEYAHLVEEWAASPAISQESPQFIR
ncbi:MAG: cytochrome b/b6 domain-containing protein [Dehalococcoidia bacterium]|nr:cytochrome b/b6 domain-containing protein [Dehalococcoidia bacterium]